MRLNPYQLTARAGRHADQRGSAVLIILVLLACMSIIIAANSAMLHSLKQELRLIDQQQQKKYGPSARH